MGIKLDSNHAALLTTDDFPLNEKIVHWKEPASEGFQDAGWVRSAEATNTPL